MNASTNIATAKAYLLNSIGSNGKFAYAANMISGVSSSDYSPLRHAGSLYALALSNQAPPDPAVAAAIIKGATYLVTNYVGALPTPTTPPTTPVWSQPVSTATPFSSDASLGTAGMGLTALCLTQQLSGSAITNDVLVGIGRFIVLLQQPSGEFYDQYVTGQGPAAMAKDRPHHGEAILGLVYLYEATNDAIWLIAAGKGLAFLAAARASLALVPADYWSAIATQRFLPHFAASQCPSTVAALQQHVTQIANAILANPAVLNGSVPLKIATRIEGLAAAYHVLSSMASANYLASIQAAAANAATKLAAAQVQTGAFAGAVTKSTSAAQAKTAGNVRIDYVQHALAAFLAYQSIA